MGINRLLILITTAALLILATACSSGSALSPEVPDSAAEQRNDYTVLDPETQETVAELYSEDLVALTHFEECGALLLESQKRVESGEVTIELPEELPENADLEKPRSVEVAFYKPNGKEPLAKVLVHKQTEPEVMQEVLALLAQG